MKLSEFVALYESTKPGFFQEFEASVRKMVPKMVKVASASQDLDKRFGSGETTFSKELLAWRIAVAELEQP